MVPRWALAMGLGVGGTLICLGSWPESWLNILLIGSGTTVIFGVFSYVNTTANAEVNAKDRAAEGK